jgi:SAM-dependent methyltransferase
MDIAASYDSAANAYARNLFHELTQKPLDRHLLNRFAEALSGNGPVMDLGCGPGQVARYLHEHGISIHGIDLSAEMVRCATKLSPGINFQVGDMRALDSADSSMSGIVAFYSIVHSTTAELGPTFREWRRVLRPGGLLLLSFHIGDEVMHVEDLWGAPVNLDFRFHQPSEIVKLLRAAGLQVTEHIEREPYEGAEYPGRRCYLFCVAA